MSAFERTLHAQPNHLTAHFALGELYAKSGQRIPALLTRPKGKCFPCDQFEPYFREIIAKALVEPFVYVALQSLNPKVAADWQQANPAKVAELKAWLGERKAPRPQTIG